MRRIPVVVLTSLLLSCGGESPTEAPLDLSFEVLDAITYATYGEEELLLDLFLPTGAPGPFPAVVFIHGGHWHAGDRKETLLQARHLASKGFVGASIEHRFYPKHVFPAALHDAKAAVRWLRANADTYHIDPSHIGIIGAGSGGHLAALVGTTNGITAFEGEGNRGFSSEVQAVAVFNPALDLVGLQHGEDRYVVECLDFFLGARYEDNPALWEHASPISHVTGASAPFLILHGTLDDVFPFDHSVRMKDALIQAGVYAEIFSAEGVAEPIWAMDQWIAPANKAIEDFFVRMFK